MAFRQAQVLGAALARGNLTAYQCAHRRIVRLPRLMTRLLLLMDQHDGLRKRAMRRMSARPLMFNRLLAAHVGAIRPWEASREAVDLTHLCCLLPRRSGTSRNHDRYGCCLENTRATAAASLWISSSACRSRNGHCKPRT